MLKKIAAVVVGYIAIALCVFLALVAAYSALGEDWAFREGIYHVSVGWSVTMLVAGLVAAVIGGMVCALVSGRSKGAVLGLAVVIVLLGVLDAGLRLTAEAPTEVELARTEATPVLEAAGKAQPPVWVTLGNPVVGVLGVLLGGAILGAGGRKGGRGS